MSASVPLRGSTLCGEGEAAVVLPSCTEMMASVKPSTYLMLLAGVWKDEATVAEQHATQQVTVDLSRSGKQIKHQHAGEANVCSLSTAAPQGASGARLTRCLPACSRAWRDAWAPAGAIGMSDLACCATGPTSPLLPDSVLAARDEPCLLSAAVGPFVSLAPLGVGLPASSLPSAALPAGVASPDEEAGRCTTRTLAAEDSAAADTFFSLTCSAGTALGCCMGRCTVPAVAA